MINVTLKSIQDNSYRISILNKIESLAGQIRKASTGTSGFCLLTDKTVRKRHSESFARSLRKAGLPVEIIDFPTGEGSKTLATVERISNSMLRKGFDRKSCILAMGGGVTGDLAGFIAGTYMRGIRFIQIPTTLLACVDSSIGGKTGVDLPAGKNSCGLFNQPAAVLIHPGFLTTLPVKELDNGLFEAIKHGVIRDADYFRSIRDHLESLRQKNPAQLSRLIRGSCIIKATVVTEDEKEKKIRMILNFGHTVGHAIETASHYRISHGRAVGLGMLAETRIGVRCGVTPPSVLAQLTDILIRLGVRISSLPEAKILIPHILKDKKNTRSADGKNPSIPVILPVSLGKVMIRRFSPIELRSLLKSI